jgi:glycerophosphoryl diester phosphodiesterase
MNQKKIFQYSLAVLCFVAACHVSQKAPSLMQTTFDSQGHRGSRGLMPENTFPAMRTALDLGVVTLEMDVVVTRDKKVVVSHEPWMGQEERSLNIYQMTYDDVKKYDVGMKPHPRFPRQQKLKVHKPLLADLLDSVQQYMMTSRRPLPFFNIETKSLPQGDGIYHPAPAEFVELLMAVIKEKQLEERVIIQSFDFRTLKYLHEKYPSIKTAMLIEGFDKRGLENQLSALGFSPTIYSPSFELVTAELVQQCHERKIKIIPWTVNDRDKILELKEMGVDGIISDYPDLFQ